MIKNSSTLYREFKSILAYLEDRMEHGVGIDQENIEHIFDFGKPYRRSTGLGLYYCKLSVEDNGGTLSVSSSGSGAGTTVRAVIKKHA